MVGEAESSQSDWCRASLSWAGHRNKSTFEVSLHWHSIGRTFPLWWNEGLSLLHACREPQNSKWGSLGWEERSQMVPPPLGDRDVLWIIPWGSAQYGIYASGKRKAVPVPHQRGTVFQEVFFNTLTLFWEVFWLRKVSLSSQVWDL